MNRRVVARGFAFLRAVYFSNQLHICRIVCFDSIALSLMTVPLRIDASRIALANGTAMTFYSYISHYQAGIGHTVRIHYSPYHWANFELQLTQSLPLSSKFVISFVLTFRQGADYVESTSRNSGMAFYYFYLNFHFFFSPSLCVISIAAREKWASKKLTRRRRKKNTYQLFIFLSAWPESCVQFNPHF